MKSQIHIRKFNIFFDKKMKRMYLFVKDKMNYLDLIKYGWIIHNLTYFMVKNGLDYSIYFCPGWAEDKIFLYAKKKNLIFLSSMDSSDIEKVERIIQKIKEIVES